jgi:hypothetical protein
MKNGAGEKYIRSSEVVVFCETNMPCIAALASKVFSSFFPFFFLILLFHPTILRL